LEIIDCPRLERHPAIEIEDVEIPNFWFSFSKGVCFHVYLVLMLNLYNRLDLSFVLYVILIWLFMFEFMSYFCTLFYFIKDLSVGFSLARFLIRQKDSDTPWILV
jgi:hypothetical protein